MIIKLIFEVKEGKGFIKINRNEFDLLDQLDNINKVLIEHDIEPFTDEDKKCLVVWKKNMYLVQQS